MESATTSHPGDRAPDEDRSPARLELARLARYARLLDASIGVPGTRLRLGLDPLIGLVPVVGDALGAALSSWIVYRAWQLGASRETLVRMLLNVGLESVLGSVPVAGDLFDAWFRANQRNVELLERDGSAAAAPRTIDVRARESRP